MQRGEQRLFCICLSECGFTDPSWCPGVLAATQIEIQWLSCSSFSASSSTFLRFGSCFSPWSAPSCQVNDPVPDLYGNDSTKVRSWQRNIGDERWIVGPGKVGVKRTKDRNLRKTTVEVENRWVGLSLCVCGLWKWVLKCLAFKWTKEPDSLWKWVLHRTICRLCTELLWCDCTSIQFSFSCFLKWSDFYTLT